mmetsp:Transcript_29980/g.41519  ORF Transcript_29980/g.41519 Transcript_29980/m.41519 type:complete len:140 (+) Transcript_29980:85-504(+)
MSAQLTLARLTFLILLVVMTFTVIYTCATDGSPFRTALLTPWMKATLIDFYTNVLVLLCWMWYKETSYLAKCFWTSLFVCLGSIGTCLYVLVQLLQLRQGQPLSRILVREGGLDINSAEFHSSGSGITESKRPLIASSE